MKTRNRGRNFRPTLDTLDERAVPAALGLHAALAPVPALFADGTFDRVTLRAATARFSAGLDQLGAQFNALQSRTAALANQQAILLDNLLGQDLIGARDQFLGTLDRTGTVSPVDFNPLASRFNALAGQVRNALTDPLGGLNNRFAAQVNALSARFSVFGQPFVAAADRFGGVFNQGVRDFRTLVVNRVGTFEDAVSPFNDLFTNAVRNFNPIEPSLTRDLVNNDFRNAITTFGSVNGQRFAVFNAGVNAFTDRLNIAVTDANRSFLDALNTTFGFNPLPNGGITPTFPIPQSGFGATLRSP